MNSVHLIGRLATDVHVKEVNGRSEVSSFILSVDRNAEEAEVAILLHAPPSALLHQSHGKSCKRLMFQKCEPAETRGVGGGEEQVAKLETLDLLRGNEVFAQD